MNGQRKTRVEAVYVGVGEWHVAHIVVRDSVKLLIRVLLPWVRGESHTMRGVCWGLKDGNVLRCGIPCRCECMRFPVQRSALKQRSKCVGRGAKTGKIECMRRLWRTRGECIIAPMYGYSVKLNAKRYKPK